MAAVFGTLHNHQVGNSHRTQEKEPSPWEFSTPDNQDVSLPVLVSSGLFVPLPTM